MILNQLTKEEASVILDKNTEAPFVGEYYNFFKEGKYICRQCETPLYLSNDKFEVGSGFAGCGWPSFDQEIDGMVKKILDKDGHRTEIICNNCGAHLGHVFSGEGFTKTNMRHCVNSISLKFVPKV